VEKLRSVLAPEILSGIRGMEDAGCVRLLFVTLRPRYLILEVLREVTSSTNSLVVVSICTSSELAENLLAGV
jgi:hypothetical protein